MKQAFFFSLTILFLHGLNAQNYTLTPGSEIKMSGATNNFDILEQGASGIYILQSRVKRVGFYAKDPYSNLYTLYKFDNNNTALFSKEYDKELNDMELCTVQMLNGELFMFATRYEKKEKSITVYGVKINKNTGELLSDWVSIDRYILDDKSNFKWVKITPTTDGSNFFIVTRITTGTNRTLTSHIINSSLSKSNSGLITFTLGGATEDVADDAIYADGKIIVLARRIQEVTVKKSVDYVLKGHYLMTFTSAGKKEKEVLVGVDGKFINQEQLIFKPGFGVLLLGFYTSEQLSKEMAGLFIFRLNKETGDLEKSIYKPVTPEMFVSRKKDIPATFPIDFIIRSVDIQPADQSIIITAELSISTTYNFIKGGTDYSFTNSHILLTRIGKDGETKWINLISKSQLESFIVTSMGSAEFGAAMTLRGGRPYHSSYATILKGDKIFLLLNDDKENTTNPVYGSKVTQITDFRKSNLYGISVDINTGDMQRKTITSNTKDMIFAPRHAFVKDQTILLPAFRDYNFSKSEFKLVKVTID